MKEKTQRVVAPASRWMDVLGTFSFILLSFFFYHPTNSPFGLTANTPSILPYLCLCPSGFRAELRRIVRVKNALYLDSMLLCVTQINSTFVCIIFVSVARFLARCLSPRSTII